MMDEDEARVMRAFSKEADKHGWKPTDAKTLRLLLTMIAASLSQHPDPDSAVTLIMSILRELVENQKHIRAAH